MLNLARFFGDTPITAPMKIGAPSFRAQDYERIIDDLKDEVQDLLNELEHAHARLDAAEAELESADGAATFLWDLASRAQRSLIVGRWEDARELLTHVVLRLGLAPRRGYKQDGDMPNKPWHIKPWHIEVSEENER